MEIPKDHYAPIMNQRGKTTRVKLTTPFLDTRSDLEKNQTEQENLSQFDLQLQNMWLSLEHEIFRKQNWEPLKHFRSKYDNQCQLSESIYEESDIREKKREMDKVCIEAIRSCIMSDQTDKVFGYLDMIEFS